MSDLLNIPFSSAGTSTGVQLTGGSFGPFRGGSALNLSDEQYAEVTLTNPPTGPYSLACYLRAHDTGSGPTESRVVVKFAGVMRFLLLPLPTALTSWTYFGIVIADSYVSVHLNGREAGRADYPATWGGPTGWALLNDSAETTGNLSISQLRAVPGNDPDFVNLVTYVPPIETIDVNYFLNGQNFKQWGVYVSESKGLIDSLDRKDNEVADWADYHGEIVNLSKPRFGVRDITLSCFLTADGKADFLDKLRGFLSELSKPNTQRLRIDAHPEKPLVYEVYAPEGTSVKKRWSDSQMVGEFELRLREPQPVKRVLKFTGPGEASITFTSRKLLDIHWGDGTHSYDLHGTARTVKHPYDTPGPHFIIISGVIEEVSDFVTNCQFIWSRLP